MTIRQLRLTHEGRPAAAVELARQLPGFDLAFHTFGSDRLLLSQALWQALQAQYGADRLPALLRDAGLEDAGPMEWTAVMREAALLGGPGPDRQHLLAAGWHWLDDVLATPPADWHMAQCRVPEAWQTGPPTRGERPSFRPGVTAARRPLEPCSPGSNPGGGAVEAVRCGSWRRRAAGVLRSSCWASSCSS